MMTQQLNVSILAAPVAAIDPRVLSQAWYSALHLARAREGAPLVRRAARSRFPMAAPGRRRDGTSPNGGAAATQRRPRPAERVWVMASGDGGSSGRSAARPLARRIELAFTSSRAAHRRATFTLGRGSARVHVILQTQGNKSSLVALCRPDLEPVVAGALAEAARALAARGIVGEVFVRGFVRCF